MKECSQCGSTVNKIQEGRRKCHNCRNIARRKNKQPKEVKDTKQKLSRKTVIDKPTIFEIEHNLKLKAPTLLEKLREQEKEKLKTHRWVFYDGGKKAVLEKINK
jgi:hypothetical protein